MAIKRLMTALCLIVLIISWSVLTAKAATFDFSDELTNWREQNAQIKSTPLGNRYCVLAQDNTNPKSMARITSPPIPIPENSEAIKRAVDVTFEYRCDITDSRKNYGAWVLVLFQGKKHYPYESFSLAGSAGWRQHTFSCAVPEGATSLSLEFRLQGRKGRFDIDDIQASLSQRELPTKGPDTKSDSRMDYSNLELLDEFKLEDGEKHKILRGNDTILTNRLKKNSLPYSFVLPSSYCNRKDLVYEIEAIVEPAWTPGVKKKKHYSVFTLGRNISGAIMPNSLSFIFLGGKMALCRITSSTGNDKIEIKNWHTVISSGQEIKLKFRWDNKNISMLMDGRHSGPVTVYNEFTWPEGRPFYIGGEDGSVSVFNGKIKTFALRIYQPQIKCHLKNGEKSAYFYGSGPHQQSLTFAGKIGKLCVSELSIADIDGKDVVEALRPTTKNDSSHTFVLPSLPFGWYTVKYLVKRKKYRKAFSHSMVIIPKKPDREPAETSPFGLATESMDLSPENVDVDKMEQDFALIAAAGIRWIRPILPWHDIERELGQYRWEGLDKLFNMAEKHGLSICMMVLGGTRPFQSYLHQEKPAWYIQINRSIPKDMDAWRNYLRTLALRYKGRISHYQIGGEPDTRCALYPFDTAMYVDWLKTSAKVLHEVDSRSKVSMGGFCVALEGDYLNKKSHTNDDSAFGGLEFYSLKPHDALDFITVHLYSCGYPGQAWEPVMPVVEKMKEFLKDQGEGDKPIWDTEVSFCSGIPGTLGGFSGKDPLISEQVQAWRLVQLYIQSAVVGIEKTFWYNSKGHSGFMYSNYFPKPAYAALSVLSEKLKAYKFSNAISQGGDLSIYEFTGNDGYMYVAWSSFGRQHIVLKPESSDAPIILSDIMGNSRNIESPQTYAARIVDEAPIYLTSSRRIQFSKLFEVKIPKSLATGFSFPLTLTLRNPANKPTTYAIGIASKGIDGIKTTLSLPAGQSQTISWIIPPTLGPLDIECQSQGGFTQHFSAQLPLARQKTAVLKSIGEEILQINTEDHVQFGGAKQLMGIVDGHGNWRGTQDASAKAILKRDGQEIQFTIQVIDDKLVSAPPNSKALYNWDCVELFIAFPGNEEGDEISQYVISPDGRTQAYGKKHPCQLNVKPSQDGYQVEGSFLLPKTVKDHFMFDVILDDADDENGYKTRLVWAGTGQNNPTSTNNYGIIRLK